MITRKDAERVADLLRDAARTEILPRFRRLDAAAIRQKTSPVDLVTDADVAAERHIQDAMARAYPNALFIGEELCESKPDRLARLADADLAVVVDPIDGTANFAAGLPLFGVMAAIVEKGETVAGIILDPIGDDWAIAVRGEGAWIRRTDDTTSDLRVAAPTAIGEMVGSAGWSHLPEAERRTVAGNLPEVATAFAYRCAAHEYRLTAGGHGHFLFYNRLMPWDHLAGVLIHREAGGYSAKRNGHPYRPGDTAGGLLVAPDEASWQQLKTVLFTPGVH